MDVKEMFNKFSQYSHTEKGIKTLKNVSLGLQIFGVLATGTGTILNNYSSRVDRQILLDNEKDKMEETFVASATEWLNSAESRIVDAKIHRAVRDELATLDPDELRLIWEEARGNE